MPLGLLRFALSREYPEPRMFRTHERLEPTYDAVIIGAGGHGLAAAYYLARDHGMTNVAVLEKGYLGGDNTGRNTTISARTTSRRRGWRSTTRACGCTRISPPTST